MPSNIAESDAWTTPLQVPDDTEAANKASLLLFAQGLTNRALFTANAVQGAAASLWLPCHPIAFPLLGSVWTAANVWDYQYSSVDSSLALTLAIPHVVARGVIDEIKAHLVMQTGHSGLPATQPKVELERRPMDGTFSSVTVAALQLAEMSVGAYEAVTQIYKTAINHTILADNYYSIRVRGEDGANALTGMKVVGAEVLFKRS